MSDRQFCTFYVEHLLLGIAIERVDEVLRHHPITPVPLAHPHVAGLLNLRGRIVTAIDARRRLGLAERSCAATPTIVVVRAAGESVSLLVDRLGDVVEVAQDQFVDMPVSVGEAIRSVASGAYELEGNLLLVLDPDQTLAVAS